MELTTTTLAALAKRREAGETIKELAAEVGITWQRLEKALRRGRSTIPAARPDRTAQVPCLELEIPAEPDPIHEAITVHAAGEGSLTEQYRPRSLKAILGQPEVVTKLASILARPRPMALLFDGETGTGKTSAALAFAQDLGCDSRYPEMGGLYVIASGEQTADSVRVVCKRLHNRPFYGSGWKVVIVNEADRMHPQAETVWLDRLEDLPPHTIVIFTTNHASTMSARFRDRCLRLTFHSEAAQLRPASRALLAAIWKDQTGKAPSEGLVEAAIADATERGRLSMRRAVMCLENKLMDLAPSPSR